MHTSIRKFSIGLGLLLATASVSAADVSGKWTADAAGTQLALEFKVDGTKLTGTVNNPQAGPAEIQDGKVNGDEVSFHLMRSINNTNTKITWNGKVAGDEIKFMRGIAGAAGAAAAPATEIIAKRAK